MSQVLDRLEAVLPEIAEHASEVDANASFPTASVDALRAAGLLGLVTPAQHGGLGADLPTAARVIARLARECASTAMVMCMHYSGAVVIAAHGSAEDNRDVAAGHHLWTVAFSEQGSRSHFWAPLSTARADGDRVVLDADKSWVTSANHATAIVWSSKPVAAEGLSTIWLVRQGTRGISAGPAFSGLGLRGNDSTPVRARGAVVAASERLGPDGGGFDIMMGVVLPHFNLMNAACSIGIMDAALRGAAAHVSGTSYAHLQSALSALPTVRAYLAKAGCQADMARALWEDALAAVAGGRADAMLRVLQAKAVAADAALEVTATCMRVCGGAAFRKEVAVERAFRDAQAAHVMGPTSDVLYDFIGKALCGLPLF